jgi:hypothetical protein
MTLEKLGDCGWNEWRDILLNAFGHRLAAIGEKGYRVVPTRKNFTVLFLQVKGFKVPVAEILSEAIRIIRENGENDSRYDTIAMMGHRIGMVENVAGLNQYLQDIRNVLRPDGQILFNSINVNATAEHGQRLYRGQNIQSEQYFGIGGRQFQHENLIGPYFSMLHVKAETLKSQSVMTKWQCEMIHRQDDDNYLARLSLS